MGRKILVTYASRNGSTTGVANAIAQTIKESGFQVEIIPILEVKDISSYQTVLVGSAIQAGQWLPEAVDFVSVHQSSLSEIQFATFTVCMTLAMPNGNKYREHVMSWLNPIRTIVKPNSEGFFAGALDIKAIKSFNERLKFRLSVIFGVWKEGDHRDWDAIHAWANNLIPLLNA